MIHGTIDHDIYIVDYTYRFNAGSSHYNNGDPGYPDDEDIKITKMWRIEEDSTSNQITIHDLPVGVYEKLETLCLEAGREEYVSGDRRGRTIY